MKKSLPIVNAPTLNCTLPVSGLKVKYRPFIIKEQKALLLAKESDNRDSILDTIKDVMNSCTSGTLDFSKATIDDIAYFFLQLRIASVGADVRFSLPCMNCQEPVVMNLDLSTIEIDTKNSSNAVMITDTVGIKFRYPTFDDTLIIDNLESNLKGIQMVKLLIEFIYDEDQVFSKDDYTDEELTDWINGLNQIQVEKIDQFFTNIPHLKHKLDFTCPHCKTEQSRLLEGLHNFFRLGSVA